MPLKLRNKERCKTCKYILYNLDFKGCFYCGAYYHTQCITHNHHRNIVKISWFFLLQISNRDMNMFYFFPHKLINSFCLFLSLLVRNVNHAVYAMGKYLKTISLVVSVKLIFIKNVDSPLLTILILLINNTIWDGIVNHAFNAASATISSLIFKTDIRKQFKFNFKELLLIQLIFSFMSTFSLYFL